MTPFKTVAALALGLALLGTGCNTKAPVEAPTKPKASTAAAVKKGSKIFSLKFTDKAGKEKAASAAELVEIKVNGSPIATKITGGDRALMALDDKVKDTDQVSVSMKSGSVVTFEPKDVPVAKDEKAEPATVWLMPYKAGAFLGQVGPDTDPMSALKGRATRIPLDRALTAAQLKAVYVGPFRMPSHLVSLDGQDLLLDSTVAFYLGAAKDKGDANPPVRLLLDGGRALTVTLKAWADEVPTAKGEALPAARGEALAVAKENVTVKEDAAADQAAFEKDVVKLDETFFPTP